MNTRKIVFSYDRPIQLQGLCRSILQNTDLRAADVTCLCRSSSAAYQAAYDQVGRELGVQIVHENRVVPGLDLRRLYEATAWMPRGRRFISRQIYKLTTPAPLGARVIELAGDADYVSLAVDDMVYFRKSSFAEATGVLADHPEISLWSWRIGVDRYPNPAVTRHDRYWTAPHRGLPIPFSYIFHTDGSVFRRADLGQWMRALPQTNTLTLNIVEGYLWSLYSREPERFSMGSLHAGPLQQTCVTWQINRVSPTAIARFHAEAYSDPAFLLQRFGGGARLDYAELYGRDDWLTHLNRVEPDKWTHVAPTQEAVKQWYSMVKQAPMT